MHSAPAPGLLSRAVPLQRGDIEFFHPEKRLRDACELCGSGNTDTQQPAAATAPRSNHRCGTIFCCNAGMRQFRCLPRKTRDRVPWQDVKVRSFVAARGRGEYPFRHGAVCPGLVGYQHQPKAVEPTGVTFGHALCKRLGHPAGQLRCARVLHHVDQEPATDADPVPAERARLLGMFDPFEHFLGTGTSQGLLHKALDFVMPLHICLEREWEKITGRGT